MYRKPLFSILVILLILCLGVTSLAAAAEDGDDQPTAATSSQPSVAEAAASPTVSPTASPEVSPTATQPSGTGDLNTPDTPAIPNLNDALSISSDYIDPAIMQSSYSQGYAPLIADNNAIIVLPLNIDMTKIKTDAPIKTSVALTGAPFIAKNFDTTVLYSQYNSGFYPFQYYLPLCWPRQNGTYQVPISITYVDTSDNNITQTFNINVIITDGPQPTPEPSETPVPSVGPVSQPKVILSNYIISPDPVYAGETFTAICTLKNTSEDRSVSNLTVIYKGATTDLMPEGGANTAYIEKISAGASEQFTFKMKVRADSASGPQKISMDISYEDSNKTAYTVSDEMTVQIRQHVRLTNDQPKFPTSAYIGDSIQATLNLYNKGKNTLYNVTVNLDVPGLYPESSAFLGNMESGSSKTADIYAAVGVDPTGAQIEPGQYKGNFLVSYEDEYGDEAVIEVPVELDIMQMQAPEYDPSLDNPEINEPETNVGLPWWIWLVIAGGAGVAIIIVAVNIRKKKRERELLEEMDDNDVS